MSFTCREICGYIDDYAPPQYAEEGDPIGLQLGSYGQEVNRLFLTLELTPETTAEALDLGSDMIFVHHTPFFTPFKQLRDEDAHNRIPLALIRRNIALYCAHTNLDSVRGGVNDVLAGLLGILDPEILQPLHPQMRDIGFGRIGLLKEPVSLDSFARAVAGKLELQDLRYYGDGNKRIRRVACCGGAGAFLVPEAKAGGADAFVTSDVKHHEGMQAWELGLGLLDAGHFHTENPIIRVLASYLKEKCPGLPIDVSTSEKSPYTAVGPRIHSA
ncbi:MAG: Nif3-like dinuclear metal center hexameric protein [Clostridiales bacterium]|nr:Nif3-like dinuclear metal center hexameric protein [Clostridiales bacterium]